MICFQDFFVLFLVSDVFSESVFFFLSATPGWLVKKKRQALGILGLKIALL